jgi:hypothetical protein
MHYKLKLHLKSLLSSLSKRPSFAKTGAVADPAVDPRNLQWFDHPLSGGASPPTYLIPKSKLPPVLYQQGEDCGPCASYVLAFAVASTLFCLSPTYTWVRISQKTYPNDTGTTASGCMASINNQGLVPLAQLGYPGNLNTIPSAAQQNTAIGNKLTYYACPSLATIQSAVAADHPVILFFSATSDFYYPVLDQNDGSYEISPRSPLSTSIGGHFMACVGYDMTRKMLDGTMGGLLMQNSWGTQWGASGEVWVSIASWNTQNGNAGSQFALSLPVAPTPAPLPPAPQPPAPPIVAQLPVITSFKTTDPMPMKFPVTITIQFSVQSNVTCQIVVATATGQILLNSGYNPINGTASGSFKYTMNGVTAFACAASNAAGQAIPKHFVW